MEREKKNGRAEITVNTESPLVERGGEEEEQQSHVGGGGGGQGRPGLDEEGDGDAEDGEGERRQREGEEGGERTRHTRSRGSPGAKKADIQDNYCKLTNDNGDAILDEENDHNDKTNEEKEIGHENTYALRKEEDSSGLKEFGARQKRDQEREREK